MKVRITVRSAPKLGIALAAALAITAEASPPRDFISDHLAGPAVHLVGDGTPGALTIVFVGDGFTAGNGQIDEYRAGVDRMVGKLLATDPFQALSTSIDIYRMDVISDGTGGIDVPVACPEGSTLPGEQFDLPPPPEDATPSIVSRTPRNPDNVLETHWCAYDSLSGRSKRRFLGSESARVSEFVLASGVTPDLTVVVVNDFWTAATAWQGGELLYVSLGRNLLNDQNPDMPGTPYPTPSDDDVAGIFVHEIGHVAPFTLLDEYSFGRSQGELAGEQAFIDASANLSTENGPAKWVPLGIPADTPACTSGNALTVGAVPGGYGFDTGVFHSRCTCIMHGEYAGSFCLVCRDRILKAFTPYVGPNNPFGAADPRSVVAPPQVRPEPPPRKEPPPLWVILDSMWMRGAPTGDYRLEYTMTVGAQTVSNAWPAVGKSAQLKRGQILESGAAIAVLSAQPSDTLTIDYRLLLIPKVAEGARAEPPSVVAHETARVPLDQLRSGLYSFTSASHRLTLGFVFGR